MAKIPSVSLWKDDEGAVAQLHAISALRVEEDGEQRWFFYGESKKDGYLYQGTSCYSTTDFSTWHNEGLVLTPEQVRGADGKTPIVERPRVLHCPTTGQYVMYLHYEEADNYNFAHMAVAVADSPREPFQLREVKQWQHCQSRDIGCFQDEDGTGYLLSEDRENGTHIFRLSEDYLSLVEDVVCLKGANEGRFGPEAPILIKRESRYYWFGSQLTGWDSNDNVYCTATDLHGPWSAWRYFAPQGSNTFDSQCDAILAVDSDTWNSQRFLYVGDRWIREDLGNSPLVMMPITIGSGVARLEFPQEWDDEFITDTFQ